MISMTGFAARRSSFGDHVWTWDLRSVNGKGLDLRLRVPDWVDGLEVAARAALQKAVVRGNVSLTLKLAREDGPDMAGFRLHEGQLAAALTALARIEALAADAGLALRPSSAAEILTLRGVQDQSGETGDTSPLRAAILTDLSRLIEEFAASRSAEGAALALILTDQADRIAALTAEAAREAASRSALQAEILRDSVARVLAVTQTVDDARLAQELALLAVKTDVTEELDRLAAHIGAARLHLADPQPVGRKLDFLMQEFMREANTLCAKAQSIGLTRIGLDLKTVIDQMREQVQNVE